MTVATGWSPRNALCDVLLAGFSISLLNHATLFNKLAQRGAPHSYTV